MKRTKLHAVEMVRRIRDQQTEKLADKTPQEVIAFFRRVGKASRQAAGASRMNRSRSRLSLTSRTSTDADDFMRSSAGRSSMTRVQ